MSFDGSSTARFGETSSASTPGNYALPAAGTPGQESVASGGGREITADSPKMAGPSVASEPKSWSMVEQRSPTQRSPRSVKRVDPDADSARGSGADPSYGGISEGVHVKAPRTDINPLAKRSASPRSSVDDDKEKLTHLISELRKRVTELQENEEVLRLDNSGFMERVEMLERMKANSEKQVEHVLKTEHGLRAAYDRSEAKMSSIAAERDSLIDAMNRMNADANDIVKKEIEKVKNEAEEKHAIEVRRLKNEVTENVEQAKAELFSSLRGEAQSYAVHEEETVLKYKTEASQAVSRANAVEYEMRSVRDTENREQWITQMKNFVEQRDQSLRDEIQVRDLDKFRLQYELTEQEKKASERAEDVRAIEDAKSEISEVKRQADHALMEKEVKMVSLRAEVNSHIYFGKVMEEMKDDVRKAETGAKEELRKLCSELTEERDALRDATVKMSLLESNSKRYRDERNQLQELVDEQGLLEDDDKPDPPPGLQASGSAAAPTSNRALGAPLYDQDHGRAVDAVTGWAQGPHGASSTRQEADGGDDGKEAAGPATPRKTGDSGLKISHKEAETVKVPSWPRPNNLTVWKATLANAICTASGDPRTDLWHSWVLKAFDTDAFFEDLGDSEHDRYRSIDQKLFAAMVGMVKNSGDGGAEVRMEMEMLITRNMNRGKATTGRQIIFLVLQNFRTHEKSDMVYTLGHLVELKFEGDKKLPEFRRNWHEILENMKKEDVPGVVSLRDIMYMKIKESKAMEFDLRYYRTLKEGHADKTLTFLLNAIERTIQSNREEKNWEMKNRALRDYRHNQAAPGVAEDGDDEGEKKKKRRSKSRTKKEKDKPGEDAAPR